MAKIFAFKSHYQKIKSIYNRFERLLLPVTLSVGFVVDYVTFVNIQINTALIILCIYWVVAFLTILFIHIYDARVQPAAEDQTTKPNKLRYLRLFAPLLIQFTFGGLLSNSFIFYWFSGSFWVSWPFILGFILLMVSNEALKNYFLKPLVQLSIYFFATFSIISVSLPFVFNSLSPWLFIISGAVSLIIIFLFAWLLSAFSGYIKKSWYILGGWVLAITVVLNVFYFAEIIPPIPLAVREAGVYHSVQRSGGQYILKGENQSFWQKLRNGEVVNLKPGERAYIFTAIFAPSALNTTIIHEWEYYDERKKDWVEKDRLSFNLIGGRKEGFRGYSWKSNLAPGSWRVFIKTERGQTLGRIKFKILNSVNQVELLEYRK